MAVIKITELPQVLSLGNQSEQGKSIQFDVTDWNTLYSGARYEITYIRPGETGSWPATGVTLSGGTLTWVVARAVTQKAGQGSFVIHCYVGDDEKNTGYVWYYIGGGHEIGETPDAVADWLAETAVAEGLRETAETARETAEGLRDEAEGLRNSAETARDEAEDLRLSAETDRIEAEGLRDSAEHDRQEAEALRVAAEAARMGFAPKGAYNAETEYKYGDWVTHDGGSYGYIYPTPSTGVPVTDESHWQQIASQGIKGDTGAKIVSGEYVGTDLVFTLDDATTVTVADMKASPDTWPQFRAAVRDGTIDQYFAVGDQFNVLKGSLNLVFDIVDIGNSVRNTAANGGAPLDAAYFTNFPNAKPVTLQMHDVINGIIFDAPEANYRINTQINSGEKCVISLGFGSTAASNFRFTASKNLVVGGKIRRISAANVTQFLYYPTAVSAAETMTMEAGEEGDGFASIAGSLSAQNDLNRVDSGSNKNTESAVRQYLGSASTAPFWTEKNIYDLPTSNYATMAGFQNGLDADFLSAIGLTTREVELNTVTDGGGNTTISDKFFLPSRKEIYGEAENVTHKGVQFQAYVGSADAAKVKYDSAALSTPRQWALRSPSVTHSFRFRGALAVSGILVAPKANESIAISAACVIL